MKMLFAVLTAAALNAAAASQPSQPAQPGPSATPSAATAAPDAVLVSDGPVKVDIRDLDAYMLRVPENMRGAVRASYDRVAAIVDSIFVTRVAAAKAREAGLDKDPDVQRRLQQVQEAFLAETYMQKLQKEVEAVDLEQRAKEIYAAEPQRFTAPAQVYVQKILVGLNGRTVDMARERARQVYHDATQGKEDFLQLAAKYSDDPDKVRNGGDIGFYPLSYFPAPVADAIAKLDTKGQVAGPIEMGDGFWIVRFVERKPEKLAPFDAVRQQIVDAERERLRKEKVEQFLAQVRGSKTVVTNTGNVESYVVKVDPASGAQAAPEGPKAGAAQPAAKR
jgi:parvulin-like peptidyl-prolyl isomerase